MEKLDLLKIVAATIIVTASAQSVHAQAARDLKCKGCVGTRDIGNGVITNKKIKDGAIKAKKLRTPAGGAYKLGANAPNIVTDTTVVSLAVTIPGPGVVIINTSGYVRFDGDNGQLTCAITKVTSPSSADPIVRANGSSLKLADRRQVISATRGYTETAAGSYTYRFVCNADTNGVHDIYDPYMTAIYVPVSIQQ